MNHKWSGWPGAYCLVRGVEDASENALGLGWYDPVSDTWDTEEHKQTVIEAQNNCPGEKEMTRQVVRESDISSRQRLYNEIENEISLQAKPKWDENFDDKNTANDWIAYIAHYASKGCTLPFDSPTFRKAMVVTAGLAISAIETYDRNNGNMAKRHYD